MRALLLLLLLSGTAPLAAHSQDALVVALLRRDGIAVPFARRDGATWTRIEAATEANARAASERWYWPTASGLRGLDGGRAIRLYIEESDLLYDQWGQITSFAPRAVKMGLGFVPRLSALLSQPVETIPFVPVDAVSSPIGRELLQQVEEAVARLARAHALPTNRELVAIESAVGLAEPIGDLELYWIDATYRLPGGDPSCPLHLSISLGLAREGQTWRRLDERVVRTDCDGKERSRYYVYAALVGSPVLLIAEEAAWEQWEKQILRLSPGGLEHVLNP